VVEVSVMSKDEGPAEQLVAAIGDFRQELIEWIDVQVNLLSQEEASPSAGAESAPVLNGGPAAVAQAQPALRTAPEFKGIKQQPEAEEAPPPSRPDSRHRLDAVARRLGEKLRQAEESRRGNEQSVRTDGREEHGRPRR
jgi:hypothetical protein